MTAAPLSEKSVVPARTIVQLAMLGLAFLLPSLDWHQAAFAAILAIVFSATILRDQGLRPGAASSGGAANAAEDRSKILLYSTSVLLLILVFRRHLEVAAAAWAIMALGDSAAGMAGAMVNGRCLPWNPRKTWAGFAAFVLAGTAGSTVFTLWVNPSLTAAKVLLVSGLASLLGAAVESVPIGLDDNLTVPLVCCGFIFCAWLTRIAALQGNLPYLGRRMLLAAVVNLTFALLALKLKSASRSGAALGFVLGLLVYLGWGWKSFLILFCFFALGSLATRAGYAGKAVRGIAEHAGGARSWREALANVGPGAFFAIFVLITRQEHAFLVALVAAFAEAAGDTVSSEIGQWLSPQAYLITSFRKVTAGENGGVSWTGSLAGIAASTVIATLGWVLGLTGAGGAAVALVAAVVGNLFDSVLGATLERRGLVTNGIVNFTATALSGALALALTLR